MKIPLHNLKHLLTLLFLLLILSCKEKPAKAQESKSNTVLALSYAEGFSATYHEDYTELIISSPWPNSSRSFSYALYKNASDIKHIPKDRYDAVLQIPVKSLVATSTTHIPALELLEEHQSLIGFPGCDYISSPLMRSKIEAGQVKELGQNEALNTEVVLSLNPDVIVGFGIEGVNKTFNTLINGGIPVIYNGDWTESSPLAKAEWLKFFGLLFDKEEKAEQLFLEIESDYISAKNLAQQATSKPTILSGAMHKDVWYLPSGRSPEGQLLKDANVEYLWQDSSGSGSLALSFETVYIKAKDADLWINPSYFTNYKQLEENSQLYTKFKAFENKSVYSASLTKGATGGVLYYELGIARPDLILKDLIKICHPELLENHTTTFFKPLTNESPNN